MTSPQVRQVVLNMLNVRGYKIPTSPSEIDAYVKAEEYLTYKEKDQDDKIFIFFPKMPKVGVTTIRQYIKEMEDNQVSHSIIVVKETITAFAKQVFNDAKPLVIEHFKEDELYVDKLKHVLVPKHELISEEEKKELMKMYKCKEFQFQWIMKSDPIARYFGAKKGQVFKITRTSETAGEYINYRIVV